MSYEEKFCFEIKGNLSKSELLNLFKDSISVFSKDFSEGEFRILSNQPQVKETHTTKEDFLSDCDSLIRQGYSIDKISWNCPVPHNGWYIIEVFFHDRLITLHISSPKETDINLVVIVFKACPKLCNVNWNNCKKYFLQ